MAAALHAEGVDDADAELLMSLRHCDFEDDEEVTAFQVTVTKKE